LKESLIYLVLNQKKSCFCARYIKRRGERGAGLPEGKKGGYRGYKGYLGLGVTVGRGLQWVGVPWLGGCRRWGYRG
jgi:hypothetical protein